MSCIIVIPIYKDQPTAMEQASIRQTFRVLGRHDIAFVTHAGCALDVYRQIVEDEKCPLRVELFDSHYFDSTAHYSDLCFSEAFYLRFQKYDYMLICQTDAWVFRDELDYWCAQGYDYIGAPIYFPYNERHFTRIFFGIGNGGFCLRRIQHCLRIVRHDRKRIFIKPRTLMRMYWHYFRFNEAFTCSIRRRLTLIGKCLAKCVGVNNNIAFYTSRHINEDMLFGSWAADAWGLVDVKLPDELTAARFAMEIGAPELYERTGKALPFGCHAFEKWDFTDFWAKHIPLTSKLIPTQQR